MLPVPVLLHILSSASDIHQRYADIEERRLQMAAIEARYRAQLELDLETARLVRDYLYSIAELKVNALQTVTQQLFHSYLGDKEHYRAQQAKLEDAKLATRSPMEWARIDARLTKIDEEIRQARRDEDSVYEKFLYVLTQVGGSGADFRRPLGPGDRSSG